MASLYSNANINGSILNTNRVMSLVGTLAPPFSIPRADAIKAFKDGRVISQSSYTNRTSFFQHKGSSGMLSTRVIHTIHRKSNLSDSNATTDEPLNQEKVPFGYSRKDVLLIGLGVTLAGIGLKSGLEFVGVDPLQAGNVVQLVLVLGLTIGWISTYIFRVSNKEMTYAQQLRDYEKKVMEKRLEGLTEGELEALLEQVEEEKRRLGGNKRVN